MGCKPCAARTAARARAGARGSTPPSGIEFVVVMNGDYSGPFADYAEASAHANDHGGQVRSRSIQ